MIDACESLAPETAERLLDLAVGHPAPGTRADLLALLVCVGVPEPLRPRLAVTLMDALSVADADLFSDLVRTAASSDNPAVVMWVRAFAATPGPRRPVALEALVDAGDPDVAIELQHLMRSPDAADRAVALRLIARCRRGGDPVPDTGAEAGADLGPADGAEVGPDAGGAALVGNTRTGASRSDRPTGGSHAVAVEAVPALRDVPAPHAPDAVPPDGAAEEAPRPTYHGILRVVGSRWFELMQRHPPIHATSLPPERLGPLLVDRLLDSAVAVADDNGGPAARELNLREWPAEMPSETAVRLARELNGAYLPDRAGLFRRYRLARRGEGPDLAVSAHTLAELAGVGSPAGAVVDLLDALLSPDARESADAAAFLRTALEQASAARRRGHPGR
ncbi:hypothetical protein LO772_28580 [Yinghuangia sp. ASG 101]|uniref:hypothetical protein n=1 Tax=Yinghuangia sp. ASG 101 TaxID=2896848 RepID=UPI001E4DBA70|nr:hypothetical protein [Yinghuangia sp. ASG 101]UGQ10745.1 hypothetical protein LO772_28580 [Yinghuangia sp. ASG 101]